MYMLEKVNTIFPNHCHLVDIYIEYIIIHIYNYNLKHKKNFKLILYYA